MATPRAMPRVFASGQSFELQRVDYLSPESSGNVGAVSAGWPLWAASWTIGTLSKSLSDELRAWVTTQRGPQRLFYGRDVARPVPLFHQDGIPFTARPTSWSQTIDDEENAVLTLGGLLAGMVLSKGDYVGFEWNTTSRSLVRVVVGGQAAGDGTLSVMVEPPVPTVTPAGAAVNLSAPTCLMRLSTDTDLGTLGRRLAVEGGKVTAVQTLRP